MDDDPVISGLQEIKDELIALRDRLIAADDYRQEAEESGDAKEAQLAKQEVAAAMLAVDEANERYRKLFELIRRKPQ